MGDKAAREVTAGRRQSRGRRMIFFFGSGRQRGGKTPGPFKKGVDRCRRPGHRATKCRVTGTPPPPEGMSRRREEKEEEEEEGRLGGARRGRREDRRDTGCAVRTRNTLRKAGGCAGETQGPVPRALPGAERRTRRRARLRHGPAAGTTGHDRPAPLLRLRSPLSIPIINKPAVLPEYAARPETGRRGFRRKGGMSGLRDVRERAPAAGPLHGSDSPAPQVRRRDRNTEAGADRQTDAGTRTPEPPGKDARPAGSGRRSASDGHPGRVFPSRTGQTT